MVLCLLRIVRKLGGVPLNRDKMKQLRLKMGLSFAEAGEAAGMSRQQWYNIESGAQRGLTLDNLEAIAKALQVKPADLLTPAKQ